MEGDDVELMSQAELKAEVELCRAKVVRLKEELAGRIQTIENQRREIQRYVPGQILKTPPWGSPFNLQSLVKMNKDLFPPTRSKSKTAKKSSSIRLGTSTSSTSRRKKRR